MITPDFPDDDGRPHEAVKAAIKRHRRREMLLAWDAYIAVYNLLSNINPIKSTTTGTTGRKDQ